MSQNAWKANYNIWIDTRLLLNGLDILRYLTEDWRLHYIEVHWSSGEPDNNVASLPLGNINSFAPWQLNCQGFGTNINKMDLCKEKGGGNSEAGFPFSVTRLYVNHSSQIINHMIQANAYTINYI